LGEVLNEYQIEFQVDGFYSETRNHCTYIRLKSHDEKWDQAKARIAAVQPKGYTRIGPAIRHANQLLEKRDSRKKWLVLLSDGKPNDYDKYEGKYGVKDVRKAIREANAKHIKVHTFAVEEKAKFYLPQIFGTRNYNVLKNPSELIASISELCQKVILLR
jgi:nitric oxide reductase NorD protein